MDNDESRNYLYHIITPTGTLRIEYRLNKALNILKEEGGKMYAVTKNLFPTKTLIAWK